MGQTSSLTAGALLCRQMFVHRLETAVGEQLVLDESRRAIVLDTAKTLYDLVMRPELLKMGMSGFRRLLMGRKGVGKTTLLHAIQRGAEKLCTPMLLCVYVTYEECRVEPLQAIRSALQQQYRLKVPASVAHVSELVTWLLKQQRVLFLVIDELQVMFTKAFTTSEELARTALSQVVSIGSSQHGRIHCILSGSSAWLRRLCFHKMTPEQLAVKKEFVHYELASDMNSTKYSACWIHPFAAASDFQAAVKLLMADEDEHQLPSDLAEVYLHTGGNPRFMEKASPGETGPLFAR